MNTEAEIEFTDDDVTPNSSIKLCKVPFDSSYSDVVDWSTDGYYNGNPYTYFKSLDGVVFNNIKFQPVNVSTVCLDITYSDEAGIAAQVAAENAALRERWQAEWDAWKLAHRSYEERLAELDAQLAKSPRQQMIDRIMAVGDAEERARLMAANPDLFEEVQ